MLNRRKHDQRPYSTECLADARQRQTAITGLSAALREMMALRDARLTVLRVRARDLYSLHSGLMERGQI